MKVTRLVEKLIKKFGSSNKLAKVLGVSGGTVRNWKLGLRKPNKLHQEELKKLYNEFKKAKSLDKIKKENRKKVLEQRIEKALKLLESERVESKIERKCKLPFYACEFLKHETFGFKEWAGDKLQDLADVRELEKLLYGFFSSNLPEPHNFLLADVSFQMFANRSSRFRTIDELYDYIQTIFTQFIIIPETDGSVSLNIFQHSI